MSDDITIAPEGIEMPFSVLGTDGEVVFRDALTFPSIGALIATTETTRADMRRARYDSYLAALAAAAVAPDEEPEDLNEGLPADGI